MIGSTRFRRPPASAGSMAAMGGVLLLAACASTPPAPDVALSEARQAIEVADRAHVDDASSPELAEARTRLASANQAVQARHMVEAKRLAQESRVDAQLAFARSDAQKNQAVNDEMLRSTDTLSEEMRRNAGAKP